MLLFPNRRKSLGHEGEAMATTTKTRPKSKVTRKAKTTTKRKATTKKATAKKATAKKATTKKATAKKATAKRKATARKATTKGKATAKRKPAAKGRVVAKGKRPAIQKSTQGLAGPACSITKAEFQRGAERLRLRIMSGGECAAELDLDRREFSSGSFGWFASEKLNVPVGGERVRCQLSVNVTVIGSKNSK